MTAPRLRTDRFGDTWRVHTGPLAREIRHTIHREQEAALARYDADPTPENRAAILSADQVEAEVARRAGQRRQEAA